MGPNRVYAVVAALAVGLAGAGRPAAQTTPAAHTADEAFFDDTVVHEIHLVINSKDWESLKAHYQENTYYPCDFRWRDQIVRNIGIRSRGQGSRNGAKPGLLAEFHHYVTGQSFLGLKSVVLRNNMQDPLGMHERVAMAFIRRMGLPAPREAHTRLFVNAGQGDQYIGLYTIVESIDNEFLQRNFHEHKGYLYNFSYGPDDKPYHFEYRGSDPALYVPKPFKPKNHKTDPQPGPIERLIWTINQTGDAGFRDAIAEYLDLQKFMAYIAIENFLAEQDGIIGNWGMNNFYFYQFEGKNLFTFLSWDRSNTFIDGPTFSIWHNIVNVADYQRNHLVDRALKYDDLRNRYLDTLVECARRASTAESVTGTAAGRRLRPAGEPVPGWLEQEVVREYDQIKADASADPNTAFTVDQFAQDFENLKTFARQRSDFVTGEVARAKGSR